MDSKNIFDLFGRQQEEINIDIEALELMKLLIETRFKLLQSKFGEHVSQTQTLVNSIKVSKNYIDLKNSKRIVGVKPSIDKNDVVVKSELEEVLDALISLEKEYSTKGIKKHELKTIINNLHFGEEKNLKPFLDVKGRRISNVSKAVHDYDVIVKIQFDDAVKSINDQVLTNHTSFKSEINSKIDEINARLDNF